MSDDFDPNTHHAQQFTGVPPSTLPGLAGFSQGARDFIKQYVPADDDEGCIGTFETVREYKPAKSQALREQAEKEQRVAGPECEVYENVTFIRINIRGNDKLEVHRPANEADKRRFPFAWQEFQKGESAASRGTHLNKLPGLDAPTIRSYNSKNVFTVEDLALVTDTHLPNLGTGAREKRQQAIEYVQSVKGSAVTQAQIKDSQDAVAQMRETVAAQGEQLAKAMALLEKQAAENDRLREENVKLSQPKKRGPKPKIKAEGAPE
jgi:hypothetical protein